ncbi:MAG TPA: alkaline phosphatase family protein [Gemmatimonadaceae bacterium]
MPHHPLANTTRAALLALAALGIAALPGTLDAQQRRAIFVSFDSFNERRALDTVDSTSTVAIRALFARGACAASARPAFPSITAPGHASLWTGAYGDVNGISANAEPQLPREEHTLLDLGSGFSSRALRAEPIWITAGAAGLRVDGHHPTQAPGVPGYLPVSGTRDSALAAARSRAERVLALPAVNVVNGYNVHVAPAMVIDERVAPPRPAHGWKHLARLGHTVPPREIAWKVGADSVYGLLYGTGRYTTLLLARTRDAAHGVTARVAPVERASPRGRRLARHFSAPLVLPAGRAEAGSDGASAAAGEDGHVWLRVRLFELDPDSAAHYLVLQPELDVVEGNHPGLGDAYQRAIGGWLPNAALRPLERQQLGPTLDRGGDGTAELRFLESAELLTRQSIRGARWMWRTHRPRLMLDYFPLADEVDHAWYGRVLPGTAPFDSVVSPRLERMRDRAWTLVDLRLAALRRLVAADANAALFVGGDHGMRATWMDFRPNVALRDAGLLVTDSSGRIDLSRTRALSPNSYWVMVNRTAWKGGIVPPERERAVLDSAASALERARGKDGAPIVTRIWRSADVDTLGMGGAVGGDLYYEVAPGYRWTSSARGGVWSPAAPEGEHGYPSIDADMQTVFCAAGRAFGARRIGAVRTIDEAPTVAAWLGIPAPPMARGRSVLGALRRAPAAAVSKQRR